MIEMEKNLVEIVPFRVIDNPTLTTQIERIEIPGDNLVFLSFWVSIMHYSPFPPDPFFVELYLLRYQEDMAFHHSRRIIRMDDSSFNPPVYENLVEKIGGIVFNKHDQIGVSCRNISFTACGWGKVV